MTGRSDALPGGGSVDRARRLLERRWAGPHVVSYAQNAEDVRLWRVFAEKRGGFYVDVGAGSPVTDSVTKLFYDAGWSGINIEPGPPFENLRTSRPRDVNLELAIAAVNGETTLWITHPDSGLSSFRRLSDALLPEGATIVEKTVRTARLDDVLGEHARGRTIDFMKIDVEGAERDVLASLDLRAWRPTVVLLEAISPVENRPTHDEWEALLVDADYLEATFDGINRFYVPVEQADLIPALDYPVTVLDRYLLGDERRSLHPSTTSVETEYAELSAWVDDVTSPDVVAREAAAQLAAMKRTLSWRITRPLRSIRRLQRAVRPRVSGVMPQRGPAPEHEAAFAVRLVQAAKLVSATTTRTPTAERRRSVNDAVRLFVAAVSDTNVDQAAVAWIAQAATSGSYPTSESVASARRVLERSEPSTLVSALQEWFASAARAERTTTVHLDIVRDAVVVDASSIASSDLHTGIQRVARETVSRWARKHPRLLLSHFDARTGAMKRLADSELARLSHWSEHIGEPGTSITHRSPEEASGDLLIPWESRLIIPELISDARHAAALAALAEARIGRSLSFIGYDMIPVIGADSLQQRGLAEAFCRHLSVVKRADHVSAISRQTASDYEAFTSMLASEGLVGPRVVPHVLPSVAPSLSEIELSSGRADLQGLPLVLVVGVHVPRKNHMAVLEAAERLWRSGVEFELLFIGGYDRSTTPEFDRYVGDLRASGWPVQVRRRASEPELWAAYRHARFTVYPSLLEGYGLPVAESLVSGTPVITSNYGCMAELAEGGGALLVDPRSVTELARAMKRLLEDDALLARLREDAGRRDLGSWDAYADAVWGFFTASEERGSHDDSRRASGVSERRSS